jgi:undecaprenyl-diphosphatase
VDPDLHALDRALFEWIYALPLPTIVSEAFSYAATRGGIWSAAALVLIAFRRGLDRRAGLAVGSGILANMVIVDLVLKRLIARERPFAELGVSMRDRLADPETYSFPSGHAVTSFMAAFVLSGRFPRARHPLLALASLIALSRIHLGAHWPSDVLVGAALGILVGAGVSVLFGVMSDEERRARDDATR